MPVVPKSGGPYSLFCTDCKTWVPNTANAEMRKEGCFAHSHICGHLAEDEVPDETWQETLRQKEARRKESEMTKEKELKEKVFRTVQHEYFVQDAINQVTTYLENQNVPPELFEGDFDFNYLAELFEENKDCNVADNDTWQNLIDNYVKVNEIDIHIPIEEFEVVIAVSGRFRTSIKARSIDEAKKRAEYQFQEADFGELEDCDGHVAHVEDANGNYHYFD